MKGGRVEGMKEVRVGGMKGGRVRGANEENFGERKGRRVEGKEVERWKRGRKECQREEERED